MLVILSRTMGQDFEVEIKPMPGCLRHSLPHMLKEVEEAWQFGVRTFVVFPKVSLALGRRVG